MAPALLVCAGVYLEVGLKAGEGCLCTCSQLAVGSFSRRMSHMLYFSPSLVFVSVCRIPQTHDLIVAVLPK